VCRLLQLEIRWNNHDDKYEPVNLYGNVDFQIIYTYRDLQDTRMVELSGQDFVVGGKCVDYFGINYDDYLPYTRLVWLQRPNFHITSTLQFYNYSNGFWRVV